MFRLNKKVTSQYKTTFMKHKYFDKLESVRGLKGSIQVLQWQLQHVCCRSQKALRHRATGPQTTGRKTTVNSSC